MRIVVVGLGYVGLSNAVLLAQKNEVIGVDTDDSRIKLLKARKSPILDPDLPNYLQRKDLNLTFSNDLIIFINNLLLSPILSISIKLFISVSIFNP